MNSLSYLHLHKTNKNLYIKSFSKHEEKRKKRKESNVLYVNKKECYSGKKPLLKPKEERTTIKNSMYTINILKNIQKDQNGAI